MLARTQPLRRMPPDNPQRRWMQPHRMPVYRRMRLSRPPPKEQAGRGVDIVAGRMVGKAVVAIAAASPALAVAPRAQPGHPSHKMG